MISLLRLVSILMLLLSIGIVAIIGLTYRNTNRFASIFSHPDGTRCEILCLFGVDPATMSLDQADKALSASVALAGSKIQRNDLPGIVYYANSRLMALANPSRSSIVVNFQTDRPTLGELMVLLGYKPERIGTTSSLPASAGTYLACRRISLYMRGYLIQFHPTGESNEKEGRCGLSEEIYSIELSFTEPIASRMSPWKGFSFDTFYYNASPVQNGPIQLPP